MPEFSNIEAIEKIKSLLPKNTVILNYKQTKKILKKDEINKQILKICGDSIGPTANDILEDEESVIYFIIENTDIKGLFIGFVDDNELESAYTCSAGKGRGELLRYYALINVNSQNNKIIKLTGGISGGIPALEYNDTHEIIEKKQKNLIKYHEKRGAIVKDLFFTYSLDTVKNNIAKK